jgi:hypothetical protein
LEARDALDFFSYFLSPFNSGYYALKKGKKKEKREPIELGSFQGLRRPVYKDRL